MSMNRSIARGQKPGQHKPRLHKPDPTMFHNSLPTQSRKDRNPVDRRSFDDAEADSLSERFAATTSTRLVRVTAGNGQILGDRQSDGSTQPARPRHGCDGAWFEIEPQRAPGPMWLLESANCADASCNPNCLLFCTSLLHSLCSYQIMEKIRPARRRCTMTPL